MSQRIIESVKKIDVQDSQLMTPEQCAAFLQVEVNTLYVMKSQGRIPHRKVGHLLRFDLKEIVEWTKPKKD
ncbi:MAG: helix-turn-helix domain-containing protein [Pyrinomonadaceae bacterium]